jgi:hypothetical protein
MSDSQIFQVLSIAYLAVGIGILVNAEFYKKMLSDFIENSAILYLGGIMALIVGYLLVAFHNIWVMDLSVIITVIGWLALIKGVVILVFPKSMIALSKSIVNSPAFMKIEAVIAIIAGLLFLFLGFCPESPFYI